MQVGNHAFAREYNDLVPHTWNIINHQVVLGRSENQCMQCGHAYGKGSFEAILQVHIHTPLRCFHGLLHSSKNASSAVSR